MTGFAGVVKNANGTAYGAFQGLDFPGGLAGKTGTADTVPGKEPTAWFVGFGPTANPQYVVVCVIDQAGYGATAAAPVVRDSSAIWPPTRSARPPSRRTRRHAVDHAGSPCPPPPPRHDHDDHPPGRARAPATGHRSGAAWLALGWRGRWSPSGHRSSRSSPRSRSRPATSGASSAPSRWSTDPTRCRGCSSTPTPTRSACPTRACRSSTRS